jgi:hypothetical protein
MDLKKPPAKPTNNMFDLEQSIADWRRQMLAAGIKTPVPLEELEIHLREEIERQMKSGLNAQHAFEFAVQKTGQGYVLNAEFAKVDGVGNPAQRERWFVSFILVGVVIPLGAYTLLKNEMSLTWRLLGFADLAVIALAVPGCQFISRSFPVVPNKRVRTAIGLAFGLLSMAGMVAFMNFILPSFELTEGQLTVVVLWGLTLMAALGAVWAGLEEAARRHEAMTDS